MAFNLPGSRKEVADRMKTDVQSQLPTSEPFKPKSFMGALIVAFAGRIFDVYLQLKELIKQMFPDTATGDYLKRWGAWVNINIKPAKQAAGPLVVTGTLTTILPLNTEFDSAAGKKYLTLDEVEMGNVSNALISLTRSGSLVTGVTVDDHNLATGMQITISGASPSDYNGTFTINVISLTSFQYSISTTPSTPATGLIVASYTGASVDVQSVDFGSNTNQPSGSQLTIATPISGINSVGHVAFSEISGGADVENNDAYRDRVEFRYQNPHALFNVPEIQSTAKQEPGVTRVWVFRVTPIIGDVTIYFVRDNDDDIIPDPTEIANVAQRIANITPAHMDAVQVHILAPTPVIVDFNFSALNPNTPAMQEAIRENLNFFFREGTNTSEDLTSDAYRSAVYQTVDTTGSPVISFDLSSPSGDVTIADGELPILGAINFP